MNELYLTFFLFISCILLIGFIVYIFAYIKIRSKKDTGQSESEDIQLTRKDFNPVLSPLTHLDWEAGGTFNPAAFHGDDGEVHLIYRAVGADGVSRLGYAISKDGKIFERLSYPVFELVNPRMTTEFGSKEKRYDPVMYPSGGSWGGCEDPRMVKIDDKIYVTFSAFDGWDFIRVGMISISEDDFLNRRWKWSRTQLLSPEGKINKNWVLFPEKIDGKFAILHSLAPEIQIDYVDRLEDLSRGVKTIQSYHGNKGPRDGWDSYIRGAGPPPLKTEHGWLILYHAIDKNEPHKYKLGAMLLDLSNPKKIIARSPAPLLVPDMWYENDWKPGVVYACGAAIEKDMLHVYYGGGDKHACAAHISLKELLGSLLQQGRVATT